MSEPRIADDFAAIAAAMRALGLEGGEPPAKPALYAFLTPERWEAAWKEDAWLRRERRRQERFRLEQEAAWQELVKQRPMDVEEQIRQQSAMRCALNQPSQLQQSALAPGDGVALGAGGASWAGSVERRSSQLEQQALAARAEAAPNEINTSDFAVMVETLRYLKPCCGRAP